MSKDRIENESVSRIFANTRKKNAYRKLESGAYGRQYRQQLDDNKAAVANDDLRAATMVRQEKRSGRYLVTMGFGKRKTWFPNDFIGKGEVLECDTLEEALRALREISKAAQNGNFDAALDKLCEQRQEHSNTMIEARNVTGFHPKRGSPSDEAPEAMP